MPRALARSMMVERFAVISATDSPRRPSLAPSSRMRMRTSPSSDQSSRRTPPAEVSPDKPALTISKFRLAPSILRCRRAGKDSACARPSPADRLSPSTTMRGRAAGATAAPGAGAAPVEAGAAAAPAAGPAAGPGGPEAAGLASAGSRGSRLHEIEIEAETISASDRNETLVHFRPEASIHSIPLPLWDRSVPDATPMGRRPVRRSSLARPSAPPNAELGPAARHGHARDLLVPLVEQVRGVREDLPRAHAPADARVEHPVRAAVDAVLVLEPRTSRPRARMRRAGDRERSRRVVEHGLRQQAKRLRIQTLPRVLDTRHAARAERAMQRRLDAAAPHVAHVGRHPAIAWRGAHPVDHVVLPAAEHRRRRAPAACEEQVRARIRRPRMLRLEVRAPLVARVVVVKLGEGRHAKRVARRGAPLH